MIQAIEGDHAKTSSPVREEMSRLATKQALFLAHASDKPGEADRKKIFDEIKASYDAQADPRYGAARLWVDAIIDPAKTRDVLIAALETCALNPDVPRFNPGVLQT